MNDDVASMPPYRAEAITLVSIYAPEGVDVEKVYDSHSPVTVDHVGAGRQGSADSGVRRKASDTVDTTPPTSPGDNDAETDSEAVPTVVMAQRLGLVGHFASTLQGPWPRIVDWSWLFRQNSPGAGGRGGPSIGGPPLPLNGPFRAYNL